MLQAVVQKAKTEQYMVRGPETNVYINGIGLLSAALHCQHGTANCVRDYYHSTVMQQAVLQEKQEP